jgi:hypothetical protein
MNTNRIKLALRKHSIRTLTADELRIAHGGDRTVVSNGTTTSSSTVFTAGTSRHKTAPPPPPPPPKN